MKQSLMIFAAVLGFTLTSHAIFAPDERVPLYLCNSGDVHAQILRNPDGTSYVIVDQAVSGGPRVIIIEENASELTNKSETVYTSKSTMIQIRRDLSGISGSTMYLTKNSQAVKVEMNCQVAYRIMDPRRG